MVRLAVAILALALVAASLVCEAQQPSGPARIGFLPIGSPSNSYDRSLVAAFRQGLRDVGVVENRDVVLEMKRLAVAPLALALLAAPLAAWR